MDTIAPLTGFAELCRLPKAQAVLPKAQAVLDAAIGEMASG
jgi:hypothetical protein